jgi:hypothetical protein
MVRHINRGTKEEP